jgi:hypothetical protein
VPVTRFAAGTDLSGVATVEAGSESEPHQYEAGQAAEMPMESGSRRSSTPARRSSSSSSMSGAGLKRPPLRSAASPAPSRELPALPDRDAVIRMQAEIAATHGDEHGERNAAKLFASYDARGTGVLDRGQIVRLLRENMGFAVTERTVDAVWTSFDVDDSGTIDSVEFTVLFSMLQRYVGQYAADKQMVKHSPGTEHTDLALAEVHKSMNQLSADELHELESQLSRLSTAVGSRKRQLTHHQVMAQIQAKSDEVLEAVKLETQELQGNIQQMKSEHEEMLAERDETIRSLRVRFCMPLLAFFPQIVLHNHVSACPIRNIIMSQPLLTCYASEMHPIHRVLSRACRKHMSSKWQ